MLLISFIVNSFLLAIFRCLDILTWRLFQLRCVFPQVGTDAESGQLLLWADFIWHFCLFDLNQVCSVVFWRVCHCLNVSQAQVVNLKIVAVFRVFLIIFN